VVNTGDGSHTLIDVQRNVTFHSIHGALTESRHVFIHNGLASIASARVDIWVLEIGFGTGLNALLAWEYAAAHPGLTIRYTGIDNGVLEPALISRLNYPDLVPLPDAGHVLLRMHGNRHFESDRFRFDLLHADATAVPYAPDTYHCVFFDAFAPQAQPEMWTSEIFQSLFHAIHPGGILVTYCAQGQFKRTLRSAGFIVEALSGPPGKREITRATKPS
jgi:tRNA U34 5-methylaminomethyl-2-thiouridine-forming methyltransferase MnmC